MTGKTRSIFVVVAALCFCAVVSFPANAETFLSGEQKKEWNILTEKLKKLQGQLKLKKGELARAKTKEDQARENCQKQKEKGKHKKKECKCCTVNSDNFTAKFLKNTRPSCCKDYVKAALKRREIADIVDELSFQIEKISARMKDLRAGKPAPPVQKAQICRIKPETMSQNGDISKNNDEIIFRSESSIAGRWQLTPGKYFIWVKRGLKDKKTKKSIINVQINQTTFKDKFSDDEVEWEKIGNYTLKENFIRVIFEIESDGAVVIQDIILTPDSGFNPKKADLSSLPVLGEK